jgi:Mrr N-terminal domain/SeqA protein N-terminal domain
MPRLLRMKRGALAHSRPSEDVVNPRSLQETSWRDYKSICNCLQVRLRSLQLNPLQPERTAVSPTVDLDTDVFEYLKSHAEPFVDTPSTVLRRLLDLSGQPASANGGTAAASLPDPKPRRRSAPQQRASKPASRKSSGRTRAPSGTLLPESAYEEPLLRALVEAGGEASYRDVVASVGQGLQDVLTPADQDTLASGGVRWHSRLQFVRLRLIERGEMDRDAPRGVWRITEAGRQAVLNGRGS